MTKFLLLQGGLRQLSQSCRDGHGMSEDVTTARCQAKTPPFFALVAQLDRAPDYESGGCKFESCREYEDFIGGLG